MANSESEDGVSRGSLKRSRLQRRFLLIVVLSITALFLVMIRSFAVAVILAGVFAGMSLPPYRVLASKLGGRRRTAALLMVLAILVVILVPLSGFLVMVFGQAVEITEMAGPWVRAQSSRLPELLAWLEGLPVVGAWVPEEQVIGTRVGEAVTRVGPFLIDKFGAATTGTASVILQLFVMLYAMYFFLLDGPTILGRVLHYAPLEEHQERQLIGRFVSVTRATIKGSIFVGLFQGALAGAAFWVVGLPGAAFWATVMAVLSVIPVLGSGLIWAPAAVILISSGRVTAGIGLGLWGLLVVSTVDNLVRPRLVGRDTKMHDLLVLLSTFGGLAMFGLVGFIIGPIVAALFLTGWGLYAEAFEDLLPTGPNWLEEDAR